MLLLLISYVFLVLTQSVYIIPWISKFLLSKEKRQNFISKKNKITGSNYWTKCSQTKNAKILYKHKKYNLGKCGLQHIFLPSWIRIKV